MIVLPDAEDRTIVSSFIWTKHRNVTDRQTDRQTDGSAVLLQRSAFRAMWTHCKKIENAGALAIFPGLRKMCFVALSSSQKNLTLILKLKRHLC